MTKSTVVHFAMVVPSIPANLYTKNLYTRQNFERMLTSFGVKISNLG